MSYFSQLQQQYKRQCCVWNECWNESMYTSEHIIVLCTLPYNTIWTHPCSHVHRYVCPIHACKQAQFTNICTNTWKLITQALENAYLGWFKGIFLWEMYIKEEDTTLVDRPRGPEYCRHPLVQIVTFGPSTENRPQIQGILMSTENNPNVTTTVTNSSNSGN